MGHARIADLSSGTAPQVARSPPSASGSPRRPPGPSGSCGRRRPAAAKRVRVGTVDGLVATNPGIPFLDGYPGLRRPRRRRSWCIVEPGRRLPARRGRDRHRRRRERDRPVQDLPAPRLPPEPVPRGLVDALSVPPVAVRSPGDQGRRRGVRPGAARHGPVRRRGRWRGRADDQHRARSSSARCPIALGQPGLIPPRVPRGCSLTVDPLLRLYPGPWQSPLRRRGRRVLLAGCPPGSGATGSTSSAALSTRTSTRSARPPGRSRRPPSAVSPGRSPGAVALGQPAPPDWPGYLDETLPMLVAAVPLVALARIGASTRLGDRNPARPALGRLLVALAGDRLDACCWSSRPPALGADATLAIAATGMAAGHRCSSGSRSSGRATRAGWAPRCWPRPCASSSRRRGRTRRSALPWTALAAVDAARIRARAAACRR